MLFRSEPDHAGVGGGAVRDQLAQPPQLAGQPSQLRVRGRAQGRGGGLEGVLAKDVADADSQKLTRFYETSILRDSSAQIPEILLTSAFAEQPGPIQLRVQKFGDTAVISWSPYTAPSQWRTRPDC